MSRRMTVRLANWPACFYSMLNRALIRLGISPGNRSAESLMAEASRRVGSDDWGDQGFREGLDLLVRSLREDFGLKLRAWPVIHRMLIRHLANRLLLRRELKHNPDILREQIPRPLFILGLPRSGTTVLLNLMAADPANRYLRGWEALFPAPLRRPSASDHDPRPAMAKRLFLRHHPSKIHAVHYIESDGPTECGQLLKNTFCSGSFFTWGPLPAYRKWMLEQDMTEVYRYHRRTLQILQYHFKGERWLLKAPLHLAAMDALLAVYPDARIVQTHRDPAESMPSTASLTAHAWRRFRYDVEPVSLGRGCVDTWAGIAARAAKVRDAWPNPSQFHDVYYGSLLADPIGTVRGIYRHFGLDWDDGLADAMRRWLAENPQGKHGRHRYTLKQFGLDRATVRQRLPDVAPRTGGEAAPNRRGRRR